MPDEFVQLRRLLEDARRKGEQFDEIFEDAVKRTLPPIGTRGSVTRKERDAVRANLLNQPMRGVWRAAFERKAFIVERRTALGVERWDILAKGALPAPVTTEPEPTPMTRTSHPVGRKAVDQRHALVA